MDNTKNQEQQKEYEQYVKKVALTHNLELQMLKAFVVGRHLLYRSVYSREGC